MSIGDFFYSSMNVYDNEKITDKLVSYIISQWNSDCIFLPRPLGVGFTASFALIIVTKSQFLWKRYDLILDHKRWY